MEESVLLNVCRACLTEEGEFQSVFVPDESCGLTIHLAEMIMAYASVQITLGDGLPEQICVPCAQKTVNMYLFKQRCEESDATLRNQLGKSPLNKTYSIAEEQRLAVEALSNIDARSIFIKPEILIDTDGQQSSQPIVDDFNESDECDDSVIEANEGKDEMVCDICQKVFHRLHQLNTHKKVHVVQKEDQDCLLPEHQEIDAIKMEGQVAAFEVMLGHEDGAESVFDVKTEDVVDDFKCTTCSRCFTNKGDFDCHLIMHQRRRRSGSGLRCSECNKKFNKASHLSRHLKIHAAIKPHVCELCNKGFARPEQLINHINAHSGVKPHVCTICSKGFNQVSNLKDHMRTHNGDKPFLCSTCGKGFNQLGNLRQHTVRHSGVKAHLCSTCGNGFASKGELCAHLRKHTGARPFVCPVCNHGFTTSSSLTKHKRIHSGEKPYECEVCKMKFSRSGILARHKRTHTGEKPYVCKFCTKAFSQSNDLSSHLRIHTGEKPYICDTCGHAFRQSSALKTHKKTHTDRTSILDIERTRSLVPIIHSTFLNATLP